MYLSHFGLTQSPFSIAPDPRFLYLTKKHQEALAHLAYGIKEGNGLLLFTGEIGTGKTTVLRYLLEQLPDNTHIALVLNPKLSEIELLETICDELGIFYPKNSRSFKGLLDLLNKHLLETYRAGGHTVLIIDEAQHLTPELLENIRLLTNLETKTRKLLQIVLVGQPELRDLLEHPTLKQVAQRIVARYHLMPLSRRDTKGYIAHRIKMAGGKSSLFSSFAFRKIFFLTQGIPRLINVLCERCLIAAFATNRSKVTPRLVKKSSKEIFGVKKKTTRTGVLLGVLILIAVSMGVFYFWRIDGIPSVSSIDPVTPYFEKPESKDFVMAYRTLFALWGIFLPDGITSENNICRFAEENHLRCDAQRGNWNSLVNRKQLWHYPGILRLYDKTGQPHFAVLLGLKENNIVAALGSTRVTLSKTDLNQYWKGEYFGLWRPLLSDKAETLEQITPRLYP